MKSTRRLLLLLAMSVLAVAAIGSSANAATHKNVKADVVYTNGKIYTVDKQFHRVAAMAIKNGRFLAVGPTAMMHGFIGRNTTVINLHGQTVIPGIIESHLHF